MGRRTLLRTFPSWVLLIRKFPGKMLTLPGLNPSSSSCPPSKTWVRKSFSLLCCLWPCAWSFFFIDFAFPSFLVKAEVWQSLGQQPLTPTEAIGRLAASIAITSLPRLPSLGKRFHRLFCRMKTKNSNLLPPAREQTKVQAFSLLP